MDMPGKRLRGRPKRRYMDVVKEDMKRSKMQRTLLKGAAKSKRRRLLIGQLCSYCSPDLVLNFNIPSCIPNFDPSEFGQQMVKEVIYFQLQRLVGLFCLLLSLESKNEGFF